MLLTAHLSSSHLDIPKNDNGQFQEWKMDYPFKKFNRKPESHDMILTVSEQHYQLKTWQLYYIHLFIHTKI